MDDYKGSIYTRLKILKEECKSEINNPLFCDVIISEKCNLHCIKCYSWKYGVETEVTIEEYKNFIISLKEFEKMPLEINLGGGEPLLNKEIFDLIMFCAKQGIPPVISTNATLINDEMARQISDSGLSRLSISLDSLNENIHDFITGTVGSYRRLMRGIEYLKKHCQKVAINIHTLISDKNMDSIEEIVEWVNKDEFFSGIAFQALAQPFRTNSVDRWYLDKEYGLLWPKDANLVSSVIDMLIDYKRSGYKIINPIAQLIVYKKYYNNPDSFSRAHRCNSGDYIFNVNVLGLVHLCCFMPPIGNIKKNKIRDIWYSEEASKTRILMHGCQKNCNNIVNCYFQDES